MKNKTKKITSIASVATLLLSINSVALAEPAQPTTYIDPQAITTSVTAPNPISAESKLFIGLIKEVKNDNVIVEKLFDIDSNIEEDATVNINIKDFKDTKYIEGDIITVHYEDISKNNDSYVITPNSQPYVEENKEVSICESPNLTIEAGFGIGEFEKNQIDKANEKGSFFRGKVISQDGDKVIVEPYFDLDTQFTKEDKVYITLTDAELKEDQSKEVKKDQEITVYYTDLNKHGDETEIVAKTFVSLDLDQIKMYSSQPSETQNTAVLTSNNDSQEPKVELVKEQKTGLFSSIGKFFKGIFSAITNLF